MLAQHAIWPRIPQTVMGCYLLVTPNYINKYFHVLLPSESIGYSRQQLFIVWTANSVFSQLIPFSIMFLLLVKDGSFFNKSIFQPDENWEVSIWSIHVEKVGEEPDPARVLLVFRLLDQVLGHQSGRLGTGLELMWRTDVHVFSKSGEVCVIEKRFASWNKKSNLC